MASGKPTGKGKRLFVPEATAKRITDLKDAAGLPFNLNKVKELTPRQIREDIPKLFYEALWMSINVMIHEHLRSKDNPKKKAACAFFLDKLCDSNFIKNLALLKEEAKAGKDAPPKAEWGK